MPDHRPFSVESAAESRRAELERSGYLVLPDFVPRADCRELMARAETLIAGYTPGAEVSLFSTTEQTSHSDRYFLESGDKIRFFFEPECVREDGSLTGPVALCLNKIGHAMHDLDPVFDRFSRRKALAELCAALGLIDPLLMQSMYILKAPHVGGEVVSHQDGTFLYTSPMSVLGFWFALEDATLENGCLWALPGGHRGGLKKRFVRGRDPQSGAVRMQFELLDPTPFPEADMVPLEVAAGTLIVLHGLLPHRSNKNVSARSRHAYTLHITEAAADYPPDNWLQRAPGFPARGFAEMA